MLDAGNREYFDIRPAAQGFGAAGAKIGVVAGLDAASGLDGDEYGTSAGLAAAELGIVAGLDVAGVDAAELGTAAGVDAAELGTVAGLDAAAGLDVVGFVAGFDAAGFVAGLDAAELGTAAGLDAAELGTVAGQDAAGGLDAVGFDTARGLCILFFAEPPESRSSTLPARLDASAEEQLSPFPFFCETSQPGLYSYFVPHPDAACSFPAPLLTPRFHVDGQGNSQHTRCVPGIVHR